MNIQENNRIEFKSELTDSLEKEVIAFLNSKEGGFIYIGVDDKGKSVGLQSVDTMQLKIKDRIKNNIMPSVMGLFDVLTETTDNKDVIKIIVAAGSEKPYYLKKLGMSEKGCFVRIGSASEPMTTRMIEEQFTKRTRTSIGKIEAPRTDLTFEQLNIYYQAKGLKLNKNFATNLELLTKEKQYNYVAYLLADENGNSIKVAKYKGTNRVDLVENNEYGYCSLIKATKQVLDKLDVENHTLTKITYKERLEKRIIDPIALREAVINAIVHNDYTTEVPPKFELFDNRIEITSTGGLPIGFNRDEFFAGFSYPRNKEIMRIFKDVEMVEYLGSGIPRILEKYSEKAFLITDNFLRITFTYDTEVLEELKKQDLLNATINESEATINKNNATINELEATINKDNATINKSKDLINEDKDLISADKDLITDLSDTESKIYFLIKNNSKITTIEMAEKLNINIRNIKRNIEKLKIKKLVERKGSRKTGYWQTI